MYDGCIRRYRFVFKYLISGTSRKKNNSIEKERDLDNNCKENIRQLIYRKYSTSKINVIQ
jgi:hypothetical protein